MRFSTAAAISGLAAVAVAESNGTWSEGPHGGPPSGSWSSSPDVWTTEVVTAFTTYCPEATALTHAGSTYSVTSATTLTITNCPGGCTITKPVSSSATAAPVTSSSSVVVPSKPVSSAASAVTSAKASVGTISPYKPSNGTAVGTGKATGTGSWSSSSPASTSGPAPYKGAATKTTFGAAGLIAALGFVAAL